MHSEVEQIKSLLLIGNRSLIRRNIRRFKKQKVRETMHESPRLIEQDREMAHHTVLRISSQWNKICQEQTKIKLAVLKYMHDQVMCVSGYGLFERVQC